MDTHRNDRPKSRVFIITDESLFMLGLENLLRRETALEVVCSEEDVDRAIERIIELMPDAVIVSETSALYEPEVLAAHILGLKEAGDIKVIGLNLQNNLMCVYPGEQRLIHDLQDLVEAIGQPAGTLTVGPCQGG